jgi:hypothetical protein
MSEKNLKRVPGLLMIGGAKRNVGKTNLILRIIEEFSALYPITGLKIKTTRQGDHFFHGSGNSNDYQWFKLIEEFETINEKDSSGMLRAGANRAFRISSQDLYLKDAFLSFLEIFPKQSLIVCESNSLRKFIKPDLYLLIKTMDNSLMKPSARELEPYADSIIFTDGVNHHFNIGDLWVNNGQWQLACLNKPN